MTVEIQKIKSSEDFETIELVANEIYAPILGYNGVASGIKYRTDIDKSYVVVDDEKIVGFYLLKSNDLTPSLKNDFCLDQPNFDFKRIENLKGVEGVALGLKTEYRGRGIGKKLMDIPKQLGYDYVWGAQDKKLDNLKYWLKRREPIVTSHTNINIEIFKK